MSNFAIEVDSVWKKFHRGEFHDSLRDFIPAMARRVMGRGPKLGELAAGDFWALKDVGFQVRRGEVLGIIGANGAGKSTLLKILAKILKPNRGQIRVNGRLSALIEVAAGFHPDLTGRENVYLNGSILGMRKREIDAKFDEIVEFSGVGAFLDMPVKRYSSGMHARLGFAVAAHLDPEILVVDEVLAVGDYEFQKKCFGKMSDVSRAGRTVLLVSHSVASIRSLCDRCCWLERGAVVGIGTTDDVLDRYINRCEAQQTQSELRIVCSDRGDGVLTNDAPEFGQYEVRCGQPLVLRFSVQTNRPIEQAGVSVSILSMDMMPVVSMSSIVQNIQSDRGPASVWHVECDLGRIPLNAGRYGTRVYFTDRNREVARFSQAQSITMVEQDVFGWGYSLPAVQHWGHVYWAPTWRICPGRT